MKCHAVISVATRKKMVCILTEDQMQDVGLHRVDISGLTLRKLPNLARALHRSSAIYSSWLSSRL